MNMDGNCRHVDVLACGCVACGSAMCVDENKCKGKERKKILTWLDVSMWTCWCADTDWMQMTVKKRKKQTERKNEKNENLLNINSVFGWWTWACRWVACGRGSVDG